MGSALPLSVGLLTIALLKLVLSRHFMQWKDGRQGCCGEASQSCRKEIRLPCSLPFSTILVMCARYRLTGTEEIAGTIWGGGGRHLPTGTVRIGFGRRPHSPARVVIKPVGTSAPARRTITMARRPDGLQSATGRGKRGGTRERPFRIYCRNLTLGTQPIQWGRTRTANPPLRQCNE
jgi:hypothetical protein